MNILVYTQQIIFVALLLAVHTTAGFGSVALTALRQKIGPDHRGENIGIYPPCYFVTIALKGLEIHKKPLHTTNSAGTGAKAAAIKEHK